MNKLAALGVLLVLAGFLSGCSGGIDITGQGDIASSSGAYNCPKEYAPCSFTNSAALKETFTATAREGWAFDHWENCQVGKGNICEFDVSAEVVRELFGRKLPPLVAHFKQASDTSLKVETVEILVNSCDSSPVLPYERHCLPRLGTSLTTALRPDNGTLTVYDWSNIPYQGAYVVTDGGWSYTGIYHFDAAVHTMTITATGDSVIMTKWVNGDSVNYYMRIEGTL